MIEMKDMSKLIGKDIWVCAYAKDDLMKKASRRIKPTHVLVGASPLTGNAVLNKILANQRLSSKPMKHLYGNKYFLTEAEAVNYYRTEVIDTVQRFKDRADAILKEEGLA